MTTNSLQSPSPFAKLPCRTRRTRRHDYDESGPFLQLVRKAQAVIPERFQFQLHPGSASFLGNEEEKVRYLGSSEDLTLLKLSNYGEDHAFDFGCRLSYARYFHNLAFLRVWDHRFFVLPHTHISQEFIGCPVRNDVRSVELIKRVIKAIEDELAGVIYGPDPAAPNC